MGYRNYREASLALGQLLGPLLNPLDRWGRPIMSAKDRLVMERRSENPAGMDKRGQVMPHSVHDMIHPSCIAKDGDNIRSGLDHHKLWANWNNVADYDCTDEYGNTETVTGRRSGIDFGANSPEDVVPYNSEALTKNGKPIPGWGDYPRITTVRPRPFHPMDSDVEELKQWYRNRPRRSGKRSPE